MPFPDQLARFNRYVTNPAARTFAGRLSPFGLLIHHGRNSGKEYRTPIWVFPARDGFTIALTYGSDRDWVRNIRTAGRFDLVYRGATYSLTDPTLIEEQRGMADLPAVLRPILRTMGVTEFLHARRDHKGNNP
jgi:deazaflavin-dependent oxidoreductase (nitroreductase family)